MNGESVFLAVTCAGLALSVAWFFRAWTARRRSVELDPELEAVIAAAAHLAYSERQDTITEGHLLWAAQRDPALGPVLQALTLPTRSVASADGDVRTRPIPTPSLSLHVALKRAGGLARRRRRRTCTLFDVLLAMREDPGGATETGLASIPLAELEAARDAGRGAVT